MRRIGEEVQAIEGRQAAFGRRLAEISEQLQVEDEAESKEGEEPEVSARAGPSERADSAARSERSAEEGEERKEEEVDGSADEDRARGAAERSPRQDAGGVAAEEDHAAASDAAASSLSASASKSRSSDKPKGFRSPKSISGLLDNNRLWRKNILRRKPWYFEEMGKKHQPTYMWIGCADARVTADRLINVAQGEMFVARNIANVVDGNDTNLMSAVYYAVEVLEVEHIIVCGHYDCGGVKAALRNVDHRPPLENWLANIRDVHRLHAEELEAITDEVQKQRRLVELNVVESCMNLFKTGVVQRRRVFTSKNPDFAYTQPALHAVVYDPGEGILKQLPVDFGSLLSKYADIYNLYQKS